MVSGSESDCAHDFPSFVTNNGNYHRLVKDYDKGNVFEMELGDRV